MTPTKFPFTEERVKALLRPPVASSSLMTPRLAASAYAVTPPHRRYPTGRKVYFNQYRVGSGRKAKQRRLPIGPTDRLSLEDARKVAKARFGEIAGGGDPQAARKEALRAEDARLDKAITAV